MAEIKVERKKEVPVWPWIAGIFVLLALIWVLIEAFDSDEANEEEFREIEVERNQGFYRDQDTREDLLANFSRLDIIAS